MPEASDTPMVSVGVPVFNAAATIEQTLTSLLAQDHADIEVLISDNGSDDDTVARCRSLVGQDARFRIITSSTNRGWQWNFRSVLAEASAQYFMWLAADDHLEPTFISANLAVLESEPTTVTSISRVRWADGSLAAGTAALDDTPRRNTATYLRHARDNSRFYGLHRTEALRASMPERDFYGMDLAIMLATLRFGTHAEIDRILMTRERTDPAGYVEHIARGATDRMDLLLPFWACTTAVRRELAVPLSAGGWWWLMVRNVYEHARFWAHRGGPYGRLLRVPFRLIDRRRESRVLGDDQQRPAPGQVARRR